MIGFEGITLYSENLSFRLLEERDKPALHALLQDPDTTRPAGFLPPVGDEAFEAFWQSLTAYNTAVAILLSGECIGYCHVNKYIPDVEPYSTQTNVGLGFLISKSHLRKGYATETLNTINPHLLERFENIWGDYFIENSASGNTLRKCGFIKADEYNMPFEELGEIKHIISTVLSRTEE